MEQHDTRATKQDQGGVEEVNWYTIGIDPGKNTGIAVYDREEKRISILKTTDFWGVINLINSNFPPRAVNILFIELPETKHVWHKGASSRAAIERTGVNIGSCIREAELLTKWAIGNGYRVLNCKPRGKVDSKRFSKLTGWTGRTNQHERDAGMMAFGV